MDVLEKFHEVVEDRHHYAQAWQQRTGGKVVGYLCAYVPEEIIYAAGCLPVRVLGAQQATDETEAYIFSMYCSYCRDVLGQGLLGKYDYLNGIVLSHVCAHIRQTFEAWRQNLPTEFAHLMWTPSHVESELAVPFFVGQTQEFERAVEEWLGRVISDEALHRAIEVYNHNRRLLRQLYDLRKEQPARISGRQAMEIVIASTIMDKVEHSQMLEELIARPPAEGKPGVRLMVVGSENNDSELVGFLESMGAVMVIEDNCLGNRYFWNDTATDGEPVASIARRSLDKLPCPLVDVATRRRSVYLLELAQEYKVQGVIFLRQKFCDPHGWEQPIMEPLFEEAALPCLCLELDLTVPAGQYRTRMQAFMELLA